MANWCGSARSNYVRVKDVEAFLAWVNTLPGVRSVEKEGRYTLLVVDTDSGGWPSVRLESPDEEEDIDLAAEVAVHLAPAEVFVYCECGAEKLRYLTGWAIAVNESGDTLEVSMEDIYALVTERWNRTASEAVY